VAGEIQLQGGGKGVRLRLPESGGFDRVLERLGHRLSDGSPVAGKAVTVDAGRRELSAEQLRALEAVILEQHGAILLQVVDGRASGAKGSGDRDEAGQAGPRHPAQGPARTAAGGLPTGGEAGRGGAEVDGQSDPAGGGEAGAPAPAPAWERGRSAGSAGERRLDAGGDVAEDTVLVKRTLRSGQRIRYNGNVVVLGDVNPGAEVVASGDIVIMGTLRGVAHAGATGNAEAIVAAFRLQPTQLRIGGVIGRAPDGGESRPDAPEVARVRGGVMLIERYQPAAAAEPSAPQRRNGAAADPA
jgi:septum site-determining protein MinC